MKKENLSKAAASGAVALVFLVLGFQAAIFTGNVFRYNREHRVDTVFVSSPPGSGYEQGLLRARENIESLFPTQACSSLNEPGGDGYFPNEIADQVGNDDRGGSFDYAQNNRGTARMEIELKDESVEDNNRHQAIAEAEQGRLCDSKAGAAGFGAEPQYYKRAGVSEANEAPRKASRRRSVIAKGIAPREELEYSDSRRVVYQKYKSGDSNRHQAIAEAEPQYFEFDPNTVTHEELVRLGFSQRQAQVIENYRSKGGKYYAPSDFAKMYVVDSAAYARLKPWIRIAKLDLNSADSAQLVSLRGIGPYYARKILDYRRSLGGVFTSTEQLLEIDGIDADRLKGFSKGVETRPKNPRFTLWDADREQLSAHPYIGSYAAKGILRYKAVADTAEWTIDRLVENGVLTGDNAARLRYLDCGRESSDK